LNTSDLPKSVIDTLWSDGTVLIFVFANWSKI